MNLTIDTRDKSFQSTIISKFSWAEFNSSIVNIKIIFIFLEIIIIIMNENRLIVKNINFIILNII